MAANTFTIYSAQSFSAPTLGSSTFQHPVLVDLSAFHSSTGYFVPNFIFTTGSVAPGPNAVVNFRYAFSNNNGYTPSAVEGQFGGVTVVPFRLPNVGSTVLDITPDDTFTIKAAYMYAWCDLVNVLGSFTLTATGYSINNS